MMRLSNLFTTLLYFTLLEIVNSSKKLSMFEIDDRLYTLMQNNVS